MRTGGTYSVEGALCPCCAIDVAVQVEARVRVRLKEANLEAVDVIERLSLVIDNP